MPSRGEIYKKVIGQALVRGLDAEEVSGIVAIRYPTPQDPRLDNLHKQSMRSLVKKVAPDWKIHIASLGEGGFTVEVRPAPGLELPPAQPVEAHEAVEPGPVVAGKEIDLGNQVQVAKIAAELRELADRLEGAA